jgi:hypothetical protein
MSSSQFNQYPCLTPVRVVASTNQSGTYVNGPLNNGVGATFTYATGALTIDSVVVLLNDNVLLVGQTAGEQNGIYVCTQQGATGVSAVLTRRHDFQCIEQLLLGQYVSVSAGTAEAGSLYALVEPKPARLGIDDMFFTAVITAGAGTASTKAASDNALPSVASVDGVTTANALAVFADTAGTIKDADAPTTLGQNLAVTGTLTASGAIASTAGNVTSGSSGDAGTFIAFPATAANGTMIVAAGNAGGAFNTTITSGTIGQSTVYTVPDIGAATGGVVVSTGAVRMKMVADAAVAGGSATQNVVDAFCTAASVVIPVWQTQANPAVIQTVVPGVGSFDIISDADAGAGSVNYVILK